MVIQHNLAAINGNRMNGIVDERKKKSSEKLSSGYRINRAADDAAGLAISEKMRRQIRGLTQASSNAQDGISMVQTAEGALNEVQDMLQRLNELCVKAANGTMTYDDRDYIQQEIYQISDEITRVGSTTTFNEIKLLDGFIQPNANAVMARATVNGSSGTIVQATNDSDAYYRIDSIKHGDIVFIPGRDGSSDTYYKAATREEILEYQRSLTEHDSSSSTVDRDGSSSDKAKLIEIYDLNRVFAKSLADDNADASTGIAELDSVEVSFALDDRDTTDFKIHFFGALEVNLQVGSNEDDDFSFNIASLSSYGLGIGEINVKDFDGAGARKGISLVKDAILKNAKERGHLGSVQNRLEHMIRNLDNVVENTTAAESRLRDTDMASEIQRNRNLDIIAQAGQSVLAQANQSKQSVMNLLQ